MPKTYHVTLVCTLRTKKITKNTVGSRGWVSSFVRKPLNVSFWRYTEFHTWKKSRNSVKFRGISRNHTSRNSAEFRRNCSEFRTEYGIDGSKKKRRNSVSAEFRGHPTQHCTDTIPKIRKGNVWPQSQFLNSYFYERFIYSHDRFSQGKEKSRRCFPLSPPPPAFSSTFFL